MESETASMHATLLSSQESEGQILGKQREYVVQRTVLELILGNRHLEQSRGCECGVENLVNALHQALAVRTILQHRHTQLQTSIDTGGTCEGTAIAGSSSVLHICAQARMGTNVVQVAGGPVQSIGLASQTSSLWQPIGWGPICQRKLEGCSRGNA